MELHAETVQILTSRLCNMMTAKGGELYELFYELSEKNWERKLMKKEENIKC
jgi:hypothetical protein